MSARAFRRRSCSLAPPSGASLLRARPLPSRALLLRRRSLPGFLVHTLGQLRASRFAVPLFEGFGRDLTPDKHLGEFAPLRLALERHRLSSLSKHRFLANTMPRHACANRCITRSQGSNNPDTVAVTKRTTA